MYIYIHIHIDIDIGRQVVDRNVNTHTHIYGRIYSFSSAAYQRVTTYVVIWCESMGGVGISPSSSGSKSSPWSTSEPARLSRREFGDDPTCNIQELSNNKKDICIYIVRLDAHRPKKQKK